MADEVIEVNDLKKYFPIQRNFFTKTTLAVHAVDSITFSIREGETLCLVGESGCGKSTAARTVLRLLEPTSGTIKLKGKDISTLSQQQLWHHRQHMQMVFQDPYASLNPRLTAESIISEPLTNYFRIPSDRLREQVRTLLEKVGLRADSIQKFPHEFSGGQRQRLGLARALALNPSLIVADEPVSALDVSVQAQVINLMVKLQDEMKLAYLFVSHDLAVVEHIGHRVAVMYLGRIVELAATADLFNSPLHPYSQALLDAAPEAKVGVKRVRKVLQGDVPSPINRPSGCHFHTRCPHAMPKCQTDSPALIAVDDDRWVACHLVAHF